MITRETKVGLVVACSFLCLVGVVLAGKYTTLLGTPPTRDADQQVAVNDKAGPENKEEKKTATQTPLETLPPDTTPALEPTPPVVQTGGTNLDDLPPLGPANGDVAPTTGKTNIGKTDEKVQDPLPPLPPMDEQKDDKTVVPPAPVKIGEAGNADKKESEKTEKPARGADAGDPKKDGGDEAAGPPLPVEEPAKKSETKPAAEVTIELPPPPPLKKARRDPVADDPESLDGKKKTIPIIPIPGDNLPAKGSSPGPEKNSADSDLAGNKQYALGKPVPLPPVANAPGSAGTGSAGAPAKRPSEPAGAPAARGPSRPTAGAGPRVESFDEETYRPRQEDTFASISKRYYQSDKYAQALLLFNREHPRAGDGVRRDPPLLTGQALYIPPIHVLEKRHGEAIEGYTPAPSNPTPVGRDVPRQTGTAAPMTYQVSPTGETMKDIARTQLHNSDRWTEIAKLNPGWRADYPIPGGTTLRLPAETRATP